MGTRQWAMGNEQWVMRNGKWTMGNEKWAMGNGQWAMRNGKWAMGNGQWTIEMGGKSGQGSFGPHATTIFSVTDACGRQSQSVSSTWKIRVFYLFFHQFVLVRPECDWYLDKQSKKRTLTILLFSIY